MLMLEMICSDEVLSKDVVKAMRVKDSQTVAQRAQSSSFPGISHLWRVTDNSLRAPVLPSVQPFLIYESQMQALLLRP